MSAQTLRQHRALGDYIRLQHELECERHTRLMRQLHDAAASTPQPEPPSVWRITLVDAVLPLAALAAWAAFGWAICCLISGVLP